MIRFAKQRAFYTNLGPRFTVAIAIAAASLWGQPPRAAYRQLYDTWRQTEPTLEQDAGAASSDFGVRAKKASEAAKEYRDARREFLLAQNEETAQHLLWMQESPTGPEFLTAPSLDSQKIGTSALQIASRTADSLAGSKDAAMQRLRQALDQERTALTALNFGVQARLKASEATAASTKMVEDVRAVLVKTYTPVAETTALAASNIEKESLGWTEYYAILTNPPASVTASRPGSGPVSDRAPSPAGPAVRVGGGTATVSSSASPARQGISVTRYVGTWTFPAAGLFHGLEPESVDMAVKTENGILSGTLSAKFRLPPGSAQSPIVTFTFSGPIADGRSQTLALRTPQGALGTIDLIPGRAFNLLEVNFQTDAAEPRIQAANFVLLKQ